MCAVVAVELLHKREVLVEVAVQITGRKGHIRLDIVVEANDLNVHAAFF